MYLKMLVHWEKQRKSKEIKIYFWPYDCNAASNLHMRGIIFELIKRSYKLKEYHNIFSPKMTNALLSCDGSHLFVRGQI